MSIREVRLTNHNLRRLWSKKSGYLCLLIGLTTGTLVGCGATPTSPNSSASPRSQQPTHSSNPFVGLSGGHLLQLSRDLTSLRQITGNTLAAYSTWWGDGLLPQTAACVAQENSASASMASNEVLIPGAARSVIGDISELSPAQQKNLQSLEKSAQTLIKADKAFGIDTTTPWSGPGSTPGITKTIVGNRLKADTRAMVLANLVVSKDVLQCSVAYSQWLHS